MSRESSRDGEGCGAPGAAEGAVVFWCQEFQFHTPDSPILLSMLYGWGNENSDNQKPCREKARNRVSFPRKIKDPQNEATELWLVGYTDHNPKDNTHAIF